MDLLLGVDAGTSVIKSIAITPDGTEQALATRSVPTQHPQPQWAEQDMNTVWNQTAACLSDLITQLPTDATIHGLSIAGQGDGCWLIDSAGEPVRDAILWSDSRAADYIEQWRHDGTLEEIAQISGSQLFPGTVLPLLAWFSSEEPQHLDDAETLLFCKDWLTYKLTNERTTELSDASLPLLDIRDQSYSDTVFESVGLAEQTQLRPSLQKAGSVIGPVTQSAAAETGLPAGTPVVAGLFDVAASALGCGAFSPGDSVSSVGTSVVNQSLRATPSNTESTIQIAFWDGLYSEAIGSNAGTQSIDWVRNELLSETEVSYTQLEEYANSVPAGAGGVVYLPYLSATGERGPFVDPNARAQFLGLDPTHTSEHLVRAVYEGLALALRDCYEAIPGSVTQLSLTGGPTRSAFWNQLVADCMGVEIRVPASTEPTATGMALLAGVGTGLYPDLETGHTRLLPSFEYYHPTEQQTATYDTLYEQYVTLRKQMTAVWETHAATQL